MFFRDNATTKVKFSLNTILLSYSLCCVVVQMKWLLLLDILKVFTIQKTERRKMCSKVSVEGVSVLVMLVLNIRELVESFGLM